MGDITAWIAEKENIAKKRGTDSARGCCDVDTLANSAVSNRRCEVFRAEQCQDVRVENIAWVKERKVRRGLIGSLKAVKKLSHFRHHGKCVVPVGYVRNYYNSLGSPTNYCPSTAGYGGDHVVEI